MLILTRRPGEEIRIDKDIQLVVLGITGNQVRLGIKAPVEKVILRAELIDPEKVA